MEPDATDMTKPRSALEIKGRMLSLTRVRILEADPTAIAAQLRNFVKSLGEAAVGMPVMLESDGPADLSLVLREMRGLGLQPLAVAEGPMAASARLLGLPVLSEDVFSEPRPRAADPAPTRAAESRPLPPEPPPVVAARPEAHVPTKVVTTPVRSGQQVYAANADLIVMATVSPGAEVIADGCVHVYGALRGRAVAGARGDQSARVFCGRQEAELIAVAGIYAVAEQVTGELRGQPAQAWLRDGKLIIDRLPD